MPKLPAPPNKLIPTATGNTIPQMDIGLENRAMFELFGNVRNIATKEMQKNIVEFEAKEKERENLNYKVALSKFNRQSHLAQNEVSQINNYSAFSKEYAKRFKKNYDNIIKTIPENYRSDFDIQANNIFMKGKKNLSTLANTKQKDAGRASVLELENDLYNVAEYSDDFEEVSLSVQGAVEAIQNSPFFDQEEKAKKIGEIQKKLKGIQRERAEIRINSLTNDEFKSNIVYAPEYQKIFDAGEKYNVSRDYMARTFMLETGGDINAKNPNSSATGAYQIIKSTAKEYDVNVKDPMSSADGAARLARDNKKVLEKSLGRPVEDWELYLAHQQGGGGASLLLKNKDKNIVEVLQSVYKNPEKAREVVSLNGGRLDMTAGEFADMWKVRYNNVKTNDIVAYSSQKKNIQDALNALPITQRMRIMSKRQKDILKEDTLKAIDEVSTNIIEQYPDDYQAQIQIAKTVKNPEHKEGIIKKINKNYSEQQKIEKQAIEETTQNILSFIQKGNIYEDIDPALLLKLPAKDQSFLKNYSEKLNKTEEKETIKERLLFAEVQEAFYENKKKFDDYSIAELASNLNSKHFDKVMKWRESEKQNINQVEANREQINRMAKDTALQLGISDKVEISILREELDLAIENFEEENGKAPNVKEVRGLVDELTENVLIEGNFWDSKKRRFLLEEDEINDAIAPDDEKEIILKMLRERDPNRVYNDDIVNEIYRKSLLNDR
jgi:hypothetical protein